MVCPSKKFFSSLVHFAILSCHAFMCYWKDSSGILLTYTIMVSTLSKFVFFVIILSLGGKKSREARAGKLGGGSITAMFLLAAGCPGRCEQMHCRGEAATIYLVISLDSSYALSKSYTAGPRCRLADWSSAPLARNVDDVPNIEERDQHDFDSFTFFGLGNVGDCIWFLLFSLFRSL